MARRTTAIQAEEVPAMVAAAAGGDADAWGRIVGHYGPRLYALALSRLRSADLAEEVAQAVMVKVAEKLGSGASGYEERGAFEAWIFRIAMNRVRDEARARTRSRSRTESLAADGPGIEGIAGPSYAGIDDRQERELEELRAAVTGLPERDQEIIALRHQGQMSFQQMSELLGEPVGTLLARHHRALKKLKKTIESSRSGDGIDEGAGETARGIGDG